MSDPALTIRSATQHDDDALSRLAWLDARPRPSGAALLAERAGVRIAAIALSSGAVVADPSYPTAAAVRRLRFRRYRLLRQGGDMAALAPLLRRQEPAAL